MHDLIIIGGGPGGVAAGVYAARKKIKTLLITEEWGGQSLVSADIRNWIGTKSVSGFDLAKMLEEHLRDQEDIEIIEGDVVSAVEKLAYGFNVKTRGGKTFETKYLLITTGSRRRKLGIPGEKELDGKGVAYCSTCDAPIFKDKVVAVVGGGNAGLEAVVDLLPYASKIYLMEYAEALRGDPITQELIKKKDGRVSIITMAETLQILGDQFVKGVKYKDRKTGEEKTLDIQGIFVEIGSIPNADFLAGMVEVNKFGEIVVDHKTQKTTTSGIWAVGDVTDVLYKQNNISAGDAVKAVLNIYELMNKE